jgi:hypothetical protein
VQLRFSCHAGVDRFQKTAKLDLLVTAMEFTNNGAGPGVERSKQVDSAVTHVIRGAELAWPGCIDNNG